MLDQSLKTCENISIKFIRGLRKVTQNRGSTVDQEDNHDLYWLFMLQIFIWLEYSLVWCWNYEYHIEKEMWVKQENTTLRKNIFMCQSGSRGMERLTIAFFLAWIQPELSMSCTMFSDTAAKCIIYWLHHDFLGMTAWSELRNLGKWILKLSRQLVMAKLWAHEKGRVE